MTLTITAHRVNDAAFEEANATGGTIKPELIVVHDTAGALTKGNVVKYFAGNSCSVSAHIVVERDGSFTQMVDFNVQANHAGRSSWKGRTNCNKFAIGIEIVNPGMMERKGEKVCLIYRDSGKEKIVGSYSFAECEEVNTSEHGKGWCLPYTPEQIDTVKELCRALCTEYGIKDIAGHFEISPKRKVDTTPLFPMEEVRAYATGAEEEPEPAVRVADVTADQLESRTIAAAGLLRKVGGTVAAAGVAKGANDVNVPVPTPPVIDIPLGEIASQLSLTQKVMEGIGAVSKFAVAHYWIAGLVIGVLLWFYGGRIINWYLEDIRTGKRKAVVKGSK